MKITYLTMQFYYFYYNEYLKGSIGVYDTQFPACCGYYPQAL